MTDITDICSHIEIRNVNGKPGAFTELYVDGRKVKGVRSVEFKHSSGSIPTLTVDLNALDIAIDQKVLMYDRTSMEGMKIIWRDNIGYSTAVELSSFVGAGFEETFEFVKELKAKGLPKKAP